MELVELVGAVVDDEGLSTFLRGMTKLRKVRLSYETNGMALVTISMTRPS